MASHAPVPFFSSTPPRLFEPGGPSSLHFGARTTKTSAPFCRNCYNFGREYPCFFVDFCFFIIVEPSFFRRTFGPVLISLYLGKREGRGKRMLADPGIAFLSPSCHAICRSRPQEPPSAFRSRFSPFLFLNLGEVADFLTCACPC